VKNINNPATILLNKLQTAKKPIAINAIKLVKLIHKFSVSKPE